MSASTLSTNIVNQTIQLVSAAEIRQEERNRLIAALEIKQAEKCKKLSCSLDSNQDIRKSDSHDYDCDYFYTADIVAIIKGEE